MLLVFRGCRRATTLLSLTKIVLSILKTHVIFLSEIGVRWQQAVQPAIDDGMQVTITRFGVVLGKGEGVLKKLSPSFYMGLGSIIGDG